MDSKKIILTFSVLAVLYWTCSILGYGWYMDKVNSPGSSQYIFMRLPVMAGFIFVFSYLLAQIIVLNKCKSNFIKTKVFLSFAGMCLVCLGAYIVSLMRNPAHQRLFSDVLAGNINYHLLDLARVILDAEGLDLMFCFVLAMVSGCVVYSEKARFDIKGFFAALSVWGAILSVKEIIKYYLPLRDADVLDIIKNMTGGILPGLMLSNRWFWRK